MKPYTEEIERLIKTLFSRLSERDRRRYAAVEAHKLGWGGKEYISNLLGIDSRTLCQGLADLKEPEDPALGRIRKPGGGRKSILDATPELAPLFLRSSENIRQAVPNTTCSGRTYDRKPLPSG